MKEAIRMACFVKLDKSCDKTALDVIEDSERGGWGACYRISLLSNSESENDTSVDTLIVCM